MEGMDLWTSMFSADFVEGEHNFNEQFNNGNNVPDDDEAEEEEDEEDGECNGDEAAANGDKAETKTGNEPDDDAIFDFELEPIVTIAEPAIAPAVTTSPRPSLPVQTMSRPLAPTRPTTSQINATDENGVAINYELGVIYICPACGTEYRQQDLWKRHMNQVHQYNTRRGLNFVAIDKLYHRCLECNKHIAMHSRENLLKHKFTHLPYRCTKCYICKREYKYRQDLMVHLRMTHCDEVVAMMREGGTASAGRKTRVREARTEEPYREYQAGADDDDDGIEVKNEVIEPDAEEQSATGMDDEQSRSSSQASAKRKRNSVAIAAAAAASAAAAVGGGNTGTDICEDYIHYMCPDCGTECDTQTQWNQHIEFVHDFVSRRGLNFRSVDMQMQCMECKQFVAPNTIKALRRHRFSHFPQQDWLRCKLCYKSYADHPKLVEHLLKHHHLETLLQDDSNENDLAECNDNDNDNEANEYDEDGLQSQNWDAPRRGGRHISAEDIYEPHIDYLCPQCGKEFNEKKQWRTHVVHAHDMNDLAKLNFAVINDRQLKCTECEKIITNAYGIQNAQQHRITHLPHKAYARCRKCHKSYTDRKGLVKHLATYHRVGYEPLKLGASGMVPTPPKQPRKQIVTVANETYEIIYLDDEEPPNGEDNDFGEQMQADDDDYAMLSGKEALKPGQTRPVNNYANRYKCVDCGSLFSTQVALKRHISEEHDFMDTQYSAKKFDNAEPALQGQASTAAGAAAAPSNTIEQNYIYLCPCCGNDYKTQFEWRRHINEVHNFDKRHYLHMRQLDKYRYQCIECKDIVCNSKLKGLQDHHFRHLPYRLYLKCLICGICYNHKPNITAHLRTRHNIIETNAAERERDLSTQLYNRLVKDTPAAATAAVAIAAEPNANANANTTNSAPVRTLKPNPGQLPMRPAGLNTLEDSISYHNAVDMDFITYYCPKCNMNFDSHAFWRKHIVEQHNYNSREGLNFRQIDNHHYLCLECYKRVTVTHTKGAIGQLQSHKFRHLPYRSFKCLTCSGEFVRKQMFFKHLNRDTNRCDSKPPISGAAQAANDDEDCAETDAQSQAESDVVDAATYSLLCPQCGDQFDTKALWREHINIVHELGKRASLSVKKVGEAMYQCSECNEMIATNKVRVLQEHRFQHLPFAAYIRCMVCNESTTVSSMLDLQQHMRAEHPTLAEDAARMVMLQDEDTSEQPEASNSNGPYMPLPPHLLDDVEEMDFDEQYLLG